MQESPFHDSVNALSYEQTRSGSSHAATYTNAFEKVSVRSPNQIAKFQLRSVDDGSNEPCTFIL